MRRTTTASLAAIAVLVAVGGVTALAETAEPGDAFYSVKMNVAEPLRSAFTVGAHQEAELQAELALRRLQEAEYLAAEGRLDAETRADLQQRFEGHADRAQELAREEHDAGDAESAVRVMTQFHADLRAHETSFKAQSDSELSLILSSLQATSADVDSAAGMFRVNVDSDTSSSTFRSSSNRSESSADSDSSETSSSDNDQTSSSTTTSSNDDDEDDDDESSTSASARGGLELDLQY